MSKSRSSVRNRKNSEKKFILAVGSLLEQSGFQSIGVNSLAKEAGLDKVLIYRYFEGIEGLLNAYIPFFPDWDLDDVTADEGKNASSFLLEYASFLVQNKVYLEVLRWGLVNENKLTLHVSSHQKVVHEAMVKMFKREGLEQDQAAGVSRLWLDSINFFALNQLKSEIYPLPTQDKVLGKFRLFIQQALPIFQTA
ncbi:MAG: TetR/AcrR family transcriptional regulator [Bacteroidota bacterium]